MSSPDARGGGADSRNVCYAAMAFSEERPPPSASHLGHATTSSSGALGVGCRWGGRGDPLIGPSEAAFLAVGQEPDRIGYPPRA